MSCHSFKSFQIIFVLFLFVLLPISLANKDEENEVSRSRSSKVTAWTGQTDRHTHTLTYRQTRPNALPFAVVIYVNA